METKFIEITINTDILQEGITKDVMIIPTDQIKYINTDMITMKGKKVFWLPEGEYKKILDKLIDCQKSETTNSTKIENVYDMDDILRKNFLYTDAVLNQIFDYKKRWNGCEIDNVFNDTPDCKYRKKRRNRCP